MEVVVVTGVLETLNGEFDEEDCNILVVVVKSVVEMVEDD